MLRGGCLIAFLVILVIFCILLFLFLAGLFSEGEDQILAITMPFLLIPVAGVLLLIGIATFVVFVGRKPVKEEGEKRSDKEKADEEVKELEDKLDTFQYRSSNCPYCPSLSVSKIIVEGPLNQRDIDVKGYSYKWEYQCNACGKRWYQVE